MNFSEIWKTRPLSKVQRLGMRFIRSRHHKAILAFAPGVGKTIPAIRTTLKIGPPILIVCRRDDFLTWKLELTNEGVEESAVHFINHGPRVDDKGRTKYALPDDWESFTFCVVSYDLVKNRAVEKWIKQHQWTCVIFDELHYLKRWKSQRTKKVYRTTLHIPVRLGLTGTFISNDPEDIFAQCLCVDLGRLFGKSEWWFKKRYYLKEGYGWYIKVGAKDKIAKKLSAIAMSVHEDDVLDLPPIIPVVKGCEMSPQQQRLTEEVIENWEIQLEDGSYMDLNLVITQLQKLRQIASGFYYKDDKAKTPVFFSCPKTDMLLRVLTSDLADKPKVVIWGAHNAELWMITKRLEEAKITYVPYFGQMSLRQREASRLRFRDDPAVRCFVGQVDRGVGMNELIVADTAIYHSNSFKVVSKQQSLRRHRRRGSEIHKSITNVELVTEGSVDERLIKRIGKAMNLADYILNQLRQGIPLRKALS